jgi:hypothetical protein
MITLGVMFNSGTDILLTEYKHAEYLNNFSSNNRYIEHKASYNEHSKKALDVMDSKGIKMKRIDERNNYIKNRKNESISTIISCLTWLFVGALFFAVHWRLHKKNM